MKHLHIAVLLALVSTTIASEGTKAWTKVDSWYHPPDTAWYSNEIIRDGGIFLLDPMAEREAERLLKSVTHLELSDEMLHSLIPTHSRSNTSEKLFLVRGVTLDSKFGRFFLRQNGDEIVVANGCLGSSPAPMKRKPIVVSLPFIPKHVYTTCSMDQ